VYERADAAMERAIAEEFVKAAGRNEGAEDSEHLF
jgi:hypothetical protein